MRVASGERGGESSVRAFKVLFSFSLGRRLNSARASRRLSRPSRSLSPQPFRAPVDDVGTTWPGLASRLATFDCLFSASRPLKGYLQRPCVEVCDVWRGLATSAISSIDSFAMSTTRNCLRSSAGRAARMAR